MALESEKEALAAKADLHRNYIGMMERAQRVPTLLVVQRLAAALGTTMGEMITEVEAEPLAKGKVRPRTTSSE